MQEAKSIHDLIEYGAKVLSQTSPSARLDAEVLLCHTTSLTRAHCHTHPDNEVLAEHVQHYLKLIDRRSKQEPVAYIVGYKEFYGLDFIVDSSVLIPRPETELLVEAGLAELSRQGRNAKFLDLGTGSACIAVAIAKQLSTAGHVALDFSRKALEIAKVNAAKHAVQDQIDFRLSNWFAAIKSNEQFSLLVANPPYIDLEDTDVSPETKFEPKTALFAQDSGLSDIKSLITDSPKYLAAGGLLLIEIGYKQGDTLVTFASNLEKGIWSDIQILKDLSGKDRILSLRKNF